ncbi:MAG: biotin transporter BioY [Cryobacterium sp.]|nr:biotin transporter BioY [Cryobacterium sp.]
MGRRELSRTRAAFSGYTLVFGRPTLADRFFERGLLSDVVLVFAAAALTAILAHVVIPGWPVPVSGQSMGALLAGGTLGAMRAAVSMVLYLGMAIAGLPVLPSSGGGIEHITLPMAGYLLGLVVTAALVGWLAQRSWDRRLSRAFLTFLVGSTIALLFGSLWLALAPGGSMGDALQHGLAVLLPEVLLKPALVTIIIASGWRVVDTEDRRRAAADLAVRG